MSNITNNRELLKKKYSTLCSYMNINVNRGYQNTNMYIREILTDFVNTHKRVGIYCYGVHTHMLLADFVADLRDVVCIIDNGAVTNDSDFLIIKDEEIEDYQLDGVIISSFNYMNEIKQGIYSKHRSVDVLDIYEELEKRGVHLEKEFYSEGPYQIYTRINELVRGCSDGSVLEKKKELISELVYIKDFRLAGELAREIYMLTEDDANKTIHQMLTDLYELELKALAESGKNNTLLLCLDGMRREDFFGGKLGKVLSILNKASCIYKNAYSYSTMTFESLVPSFSENTDQRTGYFLNEAVDSSKCRFVKKALNEDRFVAIYGDGNIYISDDSIKYSGYSQTITEKLWDFVCDADVTDNGLFYLHELYESHYSFPSPYAKDPIISNGGAMLFDFLVQNNGGLRTNYKKQQEEALRYLDDTLAPFINVLPCNMVMFADHGNLVFDRNTTLEDVKTVQLHASEDWIRIPLVVKLNGIKGEENGDLISLLDLNEIMIASMDGKKYEHTSKDHIKIGRSTIYNQQFKELYRIMSRDYNGEAFEGFVFNDGLKLIVFENGKKELYRIDDDERVYDDKRIEYLFERVSDEVSIL